MPAAPPALAMPTDGNQNSPLCAKDFARICKLIQTRAGISLLPGKQAMVHGRLLRRLRETGHAGFTAYLDALEHATGPDAAAEWQAFVNCLTTNLTSFFREEHHFHTLQQDLLARRGQPVRIWCAAASTGEEAYSMAMTLAENGGATMGQGTILCTDIDTRVLATAERGVYSAAARGLSPERLRLHFLRGTGANAGQIRVQPQVARLTEFRPFNLVQTPWSSLGGKFDIVFCRNVMIYFDRPTQRQVLEHLHAAMPRGGVLYAGHSEHFSDARDLFRLRGKTVYERV